MKLAIQKHIWEVLAVLGLFVLGIAVATYILSQQDFRFPLVEAKPKRVALELENAQAVQPGQGQTVRVAGVEVGRIADVELEEGVAVVHLDIQPEYEDLIREDATALLRPKTALKDMLVEVSPGKGRLIAMMPFSPGECRLMNLRGTSSSPKRSFDPTARNWIAMRPNQNGGMARPTNDNPVNR